MTPGTDLVVHPELTRAREALGAARERLAQALAHQDELRVSLIPSAAHRYELVLGAAALALLEAELRCARARRRLEACRAAAARGQAPDLRAIEQALDVALAEFDARVMTARAQLAFARTAVVVNHTPQDTAELRTLYRGLAKRLHPDLHPNLRPDGATDPRWYLVQAAYETFDLEAMRLLAAEVAGHREPTSTDGRETFDERLAALRAEEARVLRRVTEVRADIAQLSAKPPYSLRQELEDPTWVAAERAEMEERSAARHALAEEFEAETATYTQEDHDDRPRTN